MEEYIPIISSKKANEILAGAAQWIGLQVRFPVKAHAKPLLGGAQEATTH